MVTSGTTTSRAPSNGIPSRPTRSEAIFGPCRSSPAASSGRAATGLHQDAARSRKNNAMPGKKISKADMKARIRQKGRVPRKTSM